MPNSIEPEEGKSQQSTGASTEAWRVVCVVVVFGALGGFVAGITNNTSYCLRVPVIANKTLEMGVLGDLIIGAMTSLAACFFFWAIAGITEKDIGKPLSWMRLISISVLAGFAGIGLMNSLSSDLLRKISDVQDDVSKVDMNVIEARNMSEASIQILGGLEKFEAGESIRKEIMEIAKKEPAADSGHDSEGKTNELAKLVKNARMKYMQAQFRYGRALNIDKANVKAMIELARVYRKNAWFHEHDYSSKGHKEADDRAADREHGKAIDMLNKVISLDSKHARAYYNRACYYSIMEYRNRSLDDLEEAIALQELYREYCVYDSDFDNIRSEERFKTMTGRKGQIGGD